MAKTAKRTRADAHDDPGDRPAPPTTTLIGHAAARTAIARSAIGGRLHPTWIFHGPQGVGKYTAAVLFAGLLLDDATTSEHWNAFQPRLDARSWELIGAGTHPDLHVIRKELAAESAIAELRRKKQTNIPVALLREHMIGGVIDGKPFDGPVYRKPYHGVAKVFIIDEAELLDEVAQNLLLKTLEEPPPHTSFILVTTRPERLLPTVRSRAQSAAFGVLSDDEMDAWIDHATEDVRQALADPDARAWLARFAAGRPGAIATAVAEDLGHWRDALDPAMRSLVRGARVEALGATFDSLVDGSAEAAVKRDARASKEAAKRRAMGHLVALLAGDLRARLREAVEADRLDEAERFGDAIERLERAERQLARSVNQKMVLANLALGLSNALDPSSAEGPAIGAPS